MNARDEFEQVLCQRAAYRAFFTALSERANDRMADEMIRAANAQRGRKKKVTEVSAAKKRLADGGDAIYQRCSDQVTVVVPLLNRVQRWLDRRLDKLGADPSCEAHAGATWLLLEGFSASSYRSTNSGSHYAKGLAQMRAMDVEGVPTRIMVSNHATIRGISKYPPDGRGFRTEYVGLEPTLLGEPGPEWWTQEGKELVLSQTKHEWVEPPKVEGGGVNGCETYRVEVRVESEVDVAILKRKPGCSLREHVRRCWKGGINPRVGNPFLPYGYEEREGLDYQGRDLRVQATTS